MKQREPLITGPWIGADGREWRSIAYWVGAGYTAAFLQVKTAAGWTGY